MSFLSDMLAAITERGRSLVDFSSLSQETPTEQTAALCHSLLSSRGEASALATASEILLRYRAMDGGGKLEFFRMLLEDFGPDMKPLVAAVNVFVTSPNERAAETLHRLSEPRRQNLFRMLNQSAQGTAELIRMRAELLALLPDYPELDPVDKDFQHLFRSWFNRGFLELRKIDWRTPAAILERIIRYEAVHEIADWDDLRRRIDPSDRLLYAFFHPRLRDEPLIFVEVALAGEMASSIDSILDPDRTIVPTEKADTAIFYSISDCQPGLRGISFGNFLIKQVVEELRTNLPQLSRFVTLSPVPLFARWLSRHPTEGSDMDALSQPDWWHDGKAASGLEHKLSALAAWYLTGPRDAAGRLPDPVARFHLGNGARLERINWLANTGNAGMASSHGIMVNYLYKLDEIERNHETYASGQPVAASASVRRLAAAGARLLETAHTNGGKS
ncbi:malonyl-CoA decarboxylase [Mesorhizobium sp. VNQ89]|uniref:malonyl-CoA decarboxylase n=1 Tax=Mesorhizobium quangtriensis TaxID=3157709 RepID=UPI0032B6FFD6